MRNSVCMIACHLLTTDWRISDLFVAVLNGILFQLFNNIDHQHLTDDDLENVIAQLGD